MTPYEENISALRLVDVATADKLKNASCHIRGLSVRVAKTGSPYYYIDRDNRPLENPDDPMSDARAILKRCSRKSGGIIIKGIGMGYFLQAAYESDAERVIVCEPELAMYVNWMLHNRVAHIIKDKRFRFFVGMNAEETTQEICKAYNYGTPEQMIVLLPRNGDVIHHPIMALEKYREWSESFDKAMDIRARYASSDIATIRASASLWRHNILENRGAIARSAPVESLRGTMPKPFILCAAGPSLDRNVHMLADVQDRAVIVCVDTAYRALRMNGIAPDFVVAIDANEANGRDVKNIPDHDPRTALVYIPIVTTKITESFKDNRCYVGSFHHPLQRIMERNLDVTFGALAGAGNVATFAADFCLMAGATELIIIGMDMACGINGTGCMASHTKHALGNCRYKADSPDARIFIPKGECFDAPAWGGGRINIDTRFEVSWLWLKHHLAESGRKITNCTEGGISLELGEEAPLSCVLPSLPASSPFALPFFPIGKYWRPSILSPDEALSWEMATCRDEDVEEARREIARL